MEAETDFCIVGGGPAGLTLALLLGRSGARVAVLERSPTLDREYRGEILQPGALALLAELGVLDAARLRGGHEHTHFRFIDRGRVLIDIDYRRLRGPYNHLLSLPQPHLIAELRSAGERQGVRYLDGARVNGLRRDGDRVIGVHTAQGSTVRAHCVIAADGRYSKTRQLAGIETDRRDVFAHDVLWFKVPATMEVPPHVQIFRAAGNPVLVYRSFPDQLQIGWTLPHDGYRAMAARGVEYVREEIARAIPPYADLVRMHLRRLSDLSLLDVFTGTARDWVADGLMLIGDAAHSHSPIGAQGINLAVQDAVVAHPVLMRSLRTGDASAAALSAFPAARRPDIARVAKLQRMQSGAMLSQNRVAAVIRPAAARTLARTPLFDRVLHRIAYGNRDIGIASGLFTDNDTAPMNGS